MNRSAETSHNFFLTFSAHGVMMFVEVLSSVQTSHLESQWLTCLYQLYAFESGLHLSLIQQTAHLEMLYPKMNMHVLCSREVAEMLNDPRKHTHTGHDQYDMKK